MERINITAWAQIIGLLIMLGGYAVSFLNNQAQIRTNAQNIEMMRQDLKEMRTNQSKNEAAIAELQGTVSAALMRR